MLIEKSFERKPYGEITLATKAEPCLLHGWYVYPKLQTL